MRRFIILDTYENWVDSIEASDAKELSAKVCDLVKEMKLNPSSFTAKISTDISATDYTLVVFEVSGSGGSFSIKQDDTEIHQGIMENF